MKRAVEPVGTPLDEAAVGTTYIIVSVTVPHDLPPGPIALVLKRMEDDPRNYGVVDWELSIERAEQYLSDLLVRHREWEAMRDRDLAKR